jgi:exopolyphosphatase/guanosine-5'-triphosphate,3'-diphosphate pyrophosphatase
MKFGAIDIGSNAVRLLLCNVHESEEEAIFKKAELVRMPVRLGEDVFRFQKISEEKKLALAKSMQAFRLLMEVFGVVSFRACATAAMREAQNGREVVKFVREFSGIDIEIIDGKTEAQIIYSNHIAEHLEPDGVYLYIDVGGGSTELTVFADRHIVCSQSFNVGTIRMLHDQVPRETWNAMKDWVEKKTRGYRVITGIGSGGNINKIYKMFFRKDDKALTYAHIRETYDLLKAHTLEERITLLGLNPDRADVIVPASKIFLSVMKSAGIDKMIVPQIGLSDGIIHLLYEQHVKQVNLF